MHNWRICLHTSIYVYVLLHISIDTHASTETDIKLWYRYRYIHQLTHFLFKVKQCETALGFCYFWDHWKHPKAEQTKVGKLTEKRLQALLGPRKGTKSINWDDSPSVSSNTRQPVLFLFPILSFFLHKGPES